MRQKRAWFYTKVQDQTCLSIHGPPPRNGHRGQHSTCATVQVHQFLFEAPNRFRRSVLLTVVVVVVLTLTHNQVRGHRTGSSHS